VVAFLFPLEVAPYQEVPYQEGAFLFLAYQAAFVLGAPYQAVDLHAQVVHPYQVASVQVVHPFQVAFLFLAYQVAFGLEVLLGVPSQEEAFHAHQMHQEAFHPEVVLHDQASLGKA